jgi:hypothetical protein
MSGKWYFSLSFWFNVLAVIVAVASAFGFADFNPDPLVPTVAVLIVAVINAVIRFFPKVRVGKFSL